MKFAPRHAMTFGGRPLPRLLEGRGGACSCRLPATLQPIGIRRGLLIVDTAAVRGWLGRSSPASPATTSAEEAACQSRPSTARKPSTRSSTSSPRVNPWSRSAIRMACPTACKSGAGCDGTTRSPSAFWKRARSAFSSARRWLSRQPSAPQTRSPAAWPLMPSVGIWASSPVPSPTSLSPLGSR